MKTQEYDDDFSMDEMFESVACDHCGGEGRVTTHDYESYHGAMYKPCPVCHGDVCADQPPIS